MNEFEDSLDLLIHDVKSTCYNLRSAADLLKEVSPKEADEFLAAMVQQAEGLARTLLGFAQRRGTGE